MGEENRFWLLQIYDNKKNWVKLHLWHPLKPRYTLFIILTFIFTVIAIVFNYFFIQENDKFSLTYSIFATTIIAILIFYFTQEEIKRLEYIDALIKLLNEIQDNREKLNNFESDINDRFDANNPRKWIAKQNSYTNWGDGNNFQYKYFKTNAYFNFVNKGFILENEKDKKKNQKKFLGIPQGAIGNIYELCIDFSIKLQKIDNLIYSFDSSNERAITNIEMQKFYKKLLPEKIQSLKLTNSIILNGVLLQKDELHKMVLFDSKEDIQNFLKTQFYNYYYEDLDHHEDKQKYHVNHGFKTNSQRIYDYFYKYFPFEKNIWEIEEIERVEKEAENLIRIHANNKKLRFKELALYFIPSTLFFIALHLLKIYETPGGLALFIFLLITVAIILIWSIIHFNSLNNEELNRINTYNILDKSDEKNNSNE